LLCAEKKLLTDEYLKCIEHLASTGKELDPKSDDWRDATREAREACMAALTKLNEHRREHGC
jgi:hypothetical protein